ncbi:MFS transporter, partial [Kosmotoga sp.]
MSMFTILFVNFISAVGITIVAPILGIAGQIFEVDQGYAMWLMTGFMMAYASFMPMIGRMSDNFGRKKVFIASASIFSFGLLLSFLSNDFNIVILGRMIQGFGAGGILPVANAMAVELYQDSKGKALALVNATYGLGVVVGVNLGGIIYDHLGWKWMFIVPFILTLIVIPIAVSFLKETLKFKKHEAIDYIGSILFA